MMRKSLTGVEIKNADEGTVEAVFSVFNVVDKDGDYTFPEAIKDGTVVAISAYGHSWRNGAMPVGKGVVKNDGTRAVLQGQFFLNTQAGREHFEMVKAMGDAQEWSYGYRVTASEPMTVDGETVNGLKGVDVYEVSPVLVGAGVGTRTLSAKGLRFSEEADMVHEALSELVTRTASVIAHRSETGKSLGVESSEKMRSIAALADEIRELLTTPTADTAPEVKASEALRREYLRTLYNDNSGE